MLDRAISKPIKTFVSLLACGCDCFGAVTLQRCSNPPRERCEVAESDEPTSKAPTGRIGGALSLHVKYDGTVPIGIAYRGNVVTDVKADGASNGTGVKRGSSERYVAVMAVVFLQHGFATA